MGADLIPARVRDCECPGSPHEEGDLVFLLPHLSLEGGAAAEMERLVVMEGFTEATEAEKTRLTMRMLARLTDVYVRYGAVAWNWLQLDEKGRPEPVPFDVEVLLSQYKLAKTVASVASDLYSEDVLGPLFEAAAEAAKKEKAAGNRQQRRSRNGRTVASISRKSASTSKAPGSSSDSTSVGQPLRIAR